MTERIVLVHDNGDTATVEVVGTHGYGLRVHWSLAGDYILELKTNALKRAPQWHAQDFARAKALWEHLKPANPFWWDKANHKGKRK